MATRTKNAQIFEDCPVREIQTEQTERGLNKIVGLQTDYGVVKTNCIVNATGVWGNQLTEPIGCTLPLIPMKHAYIVTEPIDGVQRMPNLRDHDGSIYFRIRGSSIEMGGYERNPILLDDVPNDFNFGLYDLDWSVFDMHVKATEELCPAFATAGIKSTVCGPESFTPDHKPIMGPDPRVLGSIYELKITLFLCKWIQHSFSTGLFHNCGYNSAGMMLGGGEFLIL